MLIMTFLSCEDEGGENETNISYYNETESHKMGQNCMDCHKSGGPGEGWFTVAGTVYDTLLEKTYPNATVYLYTGPQGTDELKHTLEVDGLGNFYTTETVNFEPGLYATVKGSISTRHMTTVLPGGQCNACHGTSTTKIWVE
jgi:hypothetical protein